MRPHCRSLRFAFLAAVVLFAVPTIAGAHGGNDDPAVVHACIANGSKTVRIVGIGESCITSPTSKAETPAHWAIAGPQGPPGTNGTNGLNGADGTSVTFVGTFAGNQNGCPNGGATFAVAGVNAYVCNGQDGAAASRPDGPCFDNANRYVDCGNGTVTDTVTGLIWMQYLVCFSGNWAEANQAAATLKDGDCGLADGSAAGDWRLPTKAEWEATMAKGVALVCFQNGFALTNDPGTGCIASGPTSFVGHDSVSGDFWTSSTDENDPSLGILARVGLGGFLAFSKQSQFGFWIWAVRR